MTGLETNVVAALAGMFPDKFPKQPEESRRAVKALQDRVDALAERRGLDPDRERNDEALLAASMSIGDPRGSAPFHCTAEGCGREFGEEDGPNLEPANELYDHVHIAHPDAILKAADLYLSRRSAGSFCCQNSRGLATVCNTQAKRFVGHRALCADCAEYAEEDGE